MAEIPAELLAQIRAVVEGADLPPGAQVTISGPMGDVVVGTVGDI